MTGMRSFVVTVVTLLVLGLILPGLQIGSIGAAVSEGPTVSF